MTRILAIILGAVIWSAMLIGIAYHTGQRHQADADKADQLATAENDAETLRIKNRAAAAAGVRTEKAQTKTDTTFAKIRNEYETEQRLNPAIGCVLDPVSLRLWNEANAGSDGPTASESDDRLRDVAAPAGGAERSE